MYDPDWAVDVCMWNFSGLIPSIGRLERFQVMNKLIQKAHERRKTQRLPFNLSARTKGGIERNLLLDLFEGLSSIGQAEGR